MTKGRHFPFRTWATGALVAWTALAGVAETVCGQGSATFTAGGLRLVIAPNARVHEVGDTKTRARYARGSVPFCTAVVNGEERSATRMKPVAGGMQFRFSPGDLVVTLGVEARPTYLVVTVAEVEGEASALRFVNLATTNADAVLAGRIVRHGDWCLGLIPASPQVRPSCWAEDKARLVATGYGDLPSPQGVSSLAGLRAAVFACRLSDLGGTVAEIEREFDIPIGILGKAHEANRRSYVLAMKVDHANADGLIECARQGGFGSILLLQTVWADAGRKHTVPKRFFPGGAAQLQEVIGKIHAAGLLAGAHAFSTVVPKQSVYVSPRPDSRLYQDKTITLAEDVGVESDRIVTTQPPRGWPRLAGDRDVRMGDEVVTYADLSLNPPYGFAGCRRGRYGTTSQPHQADEQVHHLVTIYSRRHFLIDVGTDLLEEVADNIAVNYEAAGFDWIYLDGCDAVPEPRWYATGLAELTLLKRLKRDPVIVQAASETPFSWHLNTRTGQRDYFRVSMDPKEEVDEAVLRSVPVARESLMAADLGWFPLQRPDKKYATIDEIEYLYTKALAANAAVSVLATPDQFERIPHRGPILDIMSRLEKLRLESYFPEQVRAQVREPHADFMLVSDSAGRYHLPRAREIPFVAGSSREVRAFVAEPIDEVQTVSLWNVGKPVWLDVSTPADTVEVLDYRSERVEVVALPGARIRIPVTTRLYVRAKGMWRLEFTFQRADVTPMTEQEVSGRS